MATERKVVNEPNSNQSNSTFSELYSQNNAYQIEQTTIRSATVTHQIIETNSYCLKYKNENCRRSHETNKLPNEHVYTSVNRVL